MFNWNTKEKFLKFRAMENKLNEIFEANNSGFGAYDKPIIIAEIINHFEQEKRNMLISFCDNVVWKDKREHITTERIDKFLKENK